MAEPTSTLTFSDLILEVAVKLGVADYGASGDSAASVPSDPHDLALCQRIVNNAIRMFIHDAPSPRGWRWLRPVAGLILWPSVDPSDDNLVQTANYSAGTGLTTITVAADAFYPSMEEKSISFDDGAATFTIRGYISATSVAVAGDASGHAGNNFAVGADGAYTLPLTFGGQFLGHPTYAAGTNRGATLEWVDESVIRERRSNVGLESGTPWMVSVRLKATGTPRRRWEMVVYPQPSEMFTVEFPYMLHFDTLTELTDVSPAPFAHDESIKAACLAVAEKEVNDAIGGPDWTYYRDICLRNSYRIDQMSAPKRLGYCGNGSGAPASLTEWRASVYQRPIVSVND